MSFNVTHYSTVCFLQDRYFIGDHGAFDSVAFVLLHFKMVTYTIKPVFVWSYIYAVQNRIQIFICRTKTGLTVPLTLSLIVTRHVSLQALKQIPLLRTSGCKVHVTVQIIETSSNFEFKKVIHVTKFWNRFSLQNYDMLIKCRRYYGFHPYCTFWLMLHIMYDVIMTKIKTL